MAKQISIAQLRKDRWYVGRGQNGNVGLWDGEQFLVIGEKFDRRVIKLEGYYGRDHGCFQPFLLIDEGEMVEPFGLAGWAAHYGHTMTFRHHPDD